MILKALPAGPLMTNCYIVGDESTGEAGVFDPSGDVPTILKILEDNHLKCVVIVNTHTHFDHIGGNAELKEATGAPLVLHPEEVPGLEQASSRSRMFGENAALRSTAPISSQTASRRLAKIFNPTASSSAFILIQKDFTDHSWHDPAHIIRRRASIRAITSRSNKA